MKISKTKFGLLPEGDEVSLFTLSNDKNIQVKISTYGAIITSIETPDKDGKIENIVCGFDKLEDYISEHYLGNYPYFGCIIGRCGNRIANGDLEINGTQYKLAVNNVPNHLHGGLTGFDKKLWDAQIIDENDQVGVMLSYLSPDLEENYPGNLKVTCTYTLNNKNELSIEYGAETDKTTIVNLTNHTYFNLTAGKENILNHELRLTATKMTEMIEQIPTGKIVPVKDTPFDFTTAKTFQKDLDKLPTGYDDNYVLDNEDGMLKFVGCLLEKNSNRMVEVYTTKPGMQLYTGYWIGEMTIKGEKKFGSYSGVALETQYYPDSVHHKNFPSPVLNPGETYNHKTIYKFL